MTLSTLRARAVRLRENRRQRRYFERVVEPRVDVRGARDPRYERAVQRYWRAQLGHAVDVRWHLAYRERFGIEDPRFLPTLEWYHDIAPALNNPRMRRGHVDKNLAEVLLGRQDTPEHVVRCMHGHYLDGDYRPLSRAEAAARLGALDVRAVLKESMRDNGQGVHLIAPGEEDAPDGTEASLDALERRHGTDFVVQRYLTQHPALAAPHPSSVNTLRAITLRLGERIHHVATWARFGRNGTLTDNASTGGIVCNIGADGTLAAAASNARGEMYLSHPDTGYVFAGQRLPGAAEATSRALALHERLQHMDYVCWDFAIAPDARPLFIEMNFRGRPNICQFVLGRPLLDELTDEVLARVRRMRAWRIRRRA